VGVGVGTVLRHDGAGSKIQEKVFAMQHGCVTVTSGI
jgi:hypothetical protein